MIYLVCTHNDEMRIDAYSVKDAVKLLSRYLSGKRYILEQAIDLVDDPISLYNETTKDTDDKIKCIYTISEKLYGEDENIIDWVNVED